MKEQKVNVFVEELDDLIEERVTHFMKGEVQRRKDLKGQVVELQEELATCKKELTRATRHGCIAVQPRQKKMPEPREARQVDNFFSHLERYFEALDIDEEKVQWTVASQVKLIFNRLDDLEVDSRLTVLERKVNVFAEELDDFIKERVAHFTKWEVQRHKDLKGQVMELQEELGAYKNELTRATRQGCIALPHGGGIATRMGAMSKRGRSSSVNYKGSYIWIALMINLAEAEGRIRKYVNEYSALMLKIPEMSERQRLCFFFDGLQYWVATELQRREPHDLASAMMIVERLGDFKHCERLRSPRHERAKGRGDGRLKSGSPKATDDERNEDEGRPHYRKDCPHKGNMIAFLEKHKGSKGDSSSSDEEARMGTLQMVNAFVQKSKEETAKGKKSKKRRNLLYAMVDIAKKTQEALVDTGATHNFMSPRVAKWLGLKPTKDGSWFTAVNVEEQPTKGVVKNVDLRINEWTGNANFNIIDMDELGVVLGMDFMEKLSDTLNPYCGVMMMVEWMISLVSKDGADARKGITVLQLDKGWTLCYGERQMGPRTYAVDMHMKTVTTEKFKPYLNLIHLLSC
ncbi:hypothetical protein RJ639_015535 [Escallonia herrerae]|uniref:Uncharacterized protein n=1 Tax=Escallonia herrerae TaxID=1293975 RepID=A0AA89ALG8_9ASTE|nr:hypothetical protein RJ639_015535 [Escallonia herrerae]